MTGVDAKKADVTSLKSDVDKLDIDNLGTVSVDLRKLSNVVKMKFSQRLSLMNWLKKLMLFIQLILSN